MSIDDLIKQMQEDERTDRAETLKKLTPIEYAKLRGMTPQKVYQHLRTHRTHSEQECKGNHLETEICECGRKVLDVEKADRHFDFLHPPKEILDIIHEDPEASEMRELALEAYEEPYDENEEPE